MKEIWVEPPGKQQPINEDKINADKYFVYILFSLLPFCGQFVDGFSYSGDSFLKEKYRDIHWLWCLSIHVGPRVFLAPWFRLSRDNFVGLFERGGGSSYVQRRFIHASSLLSFKLLPNPQKRRQHLLSHGLKFDSQTRGNLFGRVLAKKKKKKVNLVTVIDRAGEKTISFCPSRCSGGH